MTDARQAATAQAPGRAAGCAESNKSRLP